MISVIIPTFNRPDLISRSINSVLSQTYSNFEIIIIDGSFNIDTKVIVDGYNDNRIRYFKINNKSASNSRNIGIFYAKGKFIAFLDDDDVWLNTKLEKQFNAFNDDNVKVIVYTSFKKIHKDFSLCTPGKKHKRRNGNLHHELLMSNFIGLPTIMLPKICCSDCIFDENLKCLEDWEWLIRLSEKFHFKFVEENLVTVYETSISVNKSSFNIKAKSYRYIYNKHIRYKVYNKDIIRKHLLSIGNNFCLSGDLLTGRQYLYKAKNINKLNFLSTICYICSFFGTDIYRNLFLLYEKITHRSP